MKNFFLAFVAEAHDMLHSLSAMTVMVVGIIFYSLLYPLPYHNEVPQKLPLLVADQDRSDLSRTLLRMLDGTEGVRVARIDAGLDTALQSLRNGEGVGALLIPADFSREILRGGKIVLPLYMDAGYLLLYRVAYRGIKLVMENMGAGVRIERFQNRGMPYDAAKALQLRGQTSIQTLYNPSGNYAQSTVPAVFVLILQQTLLIGSAILAAGHVYLPSPHSGNASSPWHLLGRLCFLVCLYCVHALYYVWFLPQYYDFPRSPATGEIILFLTPFFLACGSAGSAFARLARRPEGVLVAALPCSLPFLFLSGFSWPWEAMPPALQALSQILPSTPAINGYLYMAQRGASLSEILPLWYQLWGLALLFFGLAWAVMRRHAVEEDETC